MCALSVPAAARMSAAYRPTAQLCASLAHRANLHRTLCPSPLPLAFSQMLSSMPRDLLEELKAKLRARSAWLSGEEQREYKRAKLLNVMGAPCTAPSPARNAGGGTAADDADAFCSQVLAGSGGSGTPIRGARAGSPAPAGAGGPPLERLEMQVDARQSFATPAEVPRMRQRVATAAGAAGPWTAAAGAAVPSAHGERGGRQAGELHAFMYGADGPCCRAFCWMGCTAGVVLQGV